MAKRFTDTEKWKDEWFLSLPNDYKTIWQYILDSCTPGGILKKNFSLLNFCCKTEIDEIVFLQIFDKRVLDCVKFFFIPSFLKFQYPKGLNSEKPAILGVRNEVLSLGLFNQIKKSLGNDYLIIKDKDKVKDMDKETDKNKEKDKDSGGPEEPEGERKIIVSKPDNILEADPNFDRRGAYERFFESYPHPPNLKAKSPLSDYKAASLFMQSVVNQVLEFRILIALENYRARIGDGQTKTLFEWLKVWPDFENPEDEIEVQKPEESFT